MTTVCFWARAGPAVRTRDAPSASMRIRRVMGDLLDEESNRFLLGHEAAVHDHLRPGHERGFVRGQEEGGVRDLARLADAPERDARLELRAQLVGEVRRLERRVDDAGMDDVAPDAVAGELDRQRLVERD